MGEWWSDCYTEEDQKHWEDKVVDDTLKPCPFCGPEWAHMILDCHGWTRCRRCRCIARNTDWQSRPVEDVLEHRVAELEALERCHAALQRELEVVPKTPDEAVLWPGNIGTVAMLRARVAELEANHE